jgi:hypothetical protein
MLICSVCKQTKPETDFHLNRTRKRGYTYKCKGCISAYGKLRGASNPSFYRERSLLQKYGLTVAQYDDLLTKQNGRCAICTTTDPGDSNFHVDHDHACCPGDITCGACVRGLLCQTCNHMLGNARDSTSTLKAAVKYLNKTRRRSK